MLETALLGSMRRLSKTAHDDMFAGYGPLASFSAKIEVAYAIKIIGADLIGDLVVIPDVASFFEPSFRFLPDPAFGFGLGLESADVLVLAAWMGGDHIPFIWHAALA
jgi:hypothetical protein